MPAPLAQKLPASAVWTHAALVVVQVAFASGAVEGKIAMAPIADGGCGVEPLALAMARMLGGTLFFHALSTAGKLRVATTWRDQRALAAFAILGVVLNQGLYLLGLRLTSAFSAALLGATIPVFTAALAVLFRFESASARTAIGLTLAIGGVVWLTGVRAVDPGAVIIAVNCLSYSLYLVFSRNAVRRLGAMTLITWVFTWGALFFLPIGMPALVRGAMTWSPRAWAYVGYVVAMPTVVAYLFNAWALGRSSASLVTVYIYVQPVIAAVLAWVQLGQGVSGRMIAASALILAGVGVVATRGAAARATR